MLGNVDHRFFHDGDGARLNEIYTLNRERVTALFGARAEEILSLMARYAGEDKYATAARAETQSWLAEKNSAQTAATAREGVVTDTHSGDGTARE
jgi:hypothetical protein